MQHTDPEKTSRDAILIARVHTFFASLLGFLGFKVAPDTTVETMLDELLGWFGLAQSVRRDPHGATAKIWWDAFTRAWDDEDAGKAGVRADAAAAEFGKRFLPVADESRDTYDEQDLAAMRAELDDADKFKAEICAALDGTGTGFVFHWAKAVGELRSERDALLKANEHHAREVENLRIQKAALTAAWTDASANMQSALGCDNDANFLYVAKELRKERDELKSLLFSAIVPLPKPERVESGQRWLFPMACTGAGKVPGTYYFRDAFNQAEYEATEIDIDSGLYLGTKEGA